MCRSSRLLIEQLDLNDIRYRSFDIFSNHKLKEWLKFYADWPNFPQLYIHGKFAGGTEIILELLEKGDFMSMIPPDCIRTNAIERINAALAKSVIVIFIKGTRNKPFDGYQKEAL